MYKVLRKGKGTHQKNKEKRNAQNKYVLHTYCKENKEELSAKNKQYETVYDQIEVR